MKSVSDISGNQGKASSSLLVSPEVVTVETSSEQVEKGLNSWIAEHPEFLGIAHRLNGLQAKELRAALAFGVRADRYLKRYDRVLNATKLAQLLTQLTGKSYSRSKINDHRNAYRMYRLLKQKCGDQSPHLEITKLARAWGANKGTFNDDDKVKLCQRAAEKGLTKAQMKDEILRISTEKTRTELAYDITPTIQYVKYMDGLDLLRECDPESVDVVIIDWMYKPYMGGDTNLPQVHLPEDPAGHLIACLEVVRGILTSHGVVALFVDHQSDPDERIAPALKALGLTRMDQYVWNKPAATFSGKVGAVFANNHEIVDIYRRTDVEKFPGRLKYERSVSPKWHCRSHRTSSDEGVHPFEKPVELMKALIGAVTVNGLVVDPFAGSGSSGVAAVELGCGYRGAEMTEEYVDIANRRIAVAADRETETVDAINAALDGADDEQRAAIIVHLEKAGLKLTETKDIILEDAA